MTYLIPQLPSSGGVTLNSTWKFSTTTTASDPGSKNFRYNDANPADVTELYFNDTTNEGGDAGTILGLLSAGNRIYIQQQDDASKATLFEVVGILVDNGGWWTVPVAVVSTLALPVNNKSCVVIMSLATGSTQGTFTPTLLGSTGNPTQSYLIQEAAFNRIGDAVVIGITIAMGISGISAGTGVAMIGGLPFPARAGLNNAMAISAGNGWNTANKGVPSHCAIVGSEITLNVYANDAGNVGVIQPSDAADIGNLTSIGCSGVYFV